MVNNISVLFLDLAFLITSSNTWNVKRSKIANFSYAYNRVYPQRLSVRTLKKILEIMDDP